MDKISEFIPGASDENIEEFAQKNLSGLFGENKNS
jgi:hypothetical protein